MIEPGTLLQNRYLLTEQIGQGGMGAVYVATDQRFGSTVAVKETFFDDPNLRKAFEREARLLNSLRHSALPRVSDHFVEDDGQFLVMEFIAGDDLSSLLEKQGGPFPVDRAVGWAEQLLDALEYLHDQNPPIIHRDIKPQNLKLTERDHIILLDFGLAKGAPSNLSRVTNTGSVFGYSRSYAPLEQIQGAGTDTRSDLYSLAATLYHLLTGVTPPDAVSRATAVINGQPDPMVPANEVNRAVSQDIAGVLSRALSQNANQRPATAREMRHALKTADRTPGAGRATAAMASAPTIFDQATQILPAGTNTPREGGAISAANAANTVPDLELQNALPRDTSKTGGNSIATLVAPRTPTAKRNRAKWLIAAVATVLLGCGAYGYYRYTKRVPAAPPSSGTGTPVQTVNVPGTTEQPSPSPVVAAPTPTPATSSSPTTSRTGKTPSTRYPSGQGDQVEVDVPEPPDTDDEPDGPPPRRDRNGRPLPPFGHPGQPPPGDPNEAERLRRLREMQREMRLRRQQQMREQRRRQQQQPQPAP